ncbi:MAG: anti-sigma factor family protein [Armatimonadota bacterium]
MNCKQVLVVLSAYMDGELELPEIESVRAHLAGCDSCLPELERLQRTAATLAATPEIEPPAFLLQAIMEATAKKPSVLENLRAALRPAYVSAVAGIAVILAAFFMWPSEPAPAPTPAAAPVRVAEIPVPAPEAIYKPPARPEVKAAAKRRHAGQLRRTEPVAVQPKPSVQPTLPAEEPAVAKPEVPAEPVLVKVIGAEEDEGVKVASTGNLIFEEEPTVHFDLKEKIAKRNRELNYADHMPRFETSEISMEIARVSF